MNVYIMGPNNYSNSELGQITFAKMVSLTNKIVVFLAGGCTTDWRKEFINEFKKLAATSKYNVDIIFANPKYETKIDDTELIKWENEAADYSKYFVFNFEGSESTQPFSLFELGRYLTTAAFKYRICDKNIKPVDTILINMDKNYKCFDGVVGHIYGLQEVNSIADEHKVKHVSVSMTELAKMLFNQIGG